VGVQKEKLADLEKISLLPRREENDLETRGIAARCLTLAKNDGEIIPVKSTQ
jgi:hypothetical protein